MQGCIKDGKNIDPSMGSGHILVYAFDVLYHIYLKANYSQRDIPRLILEKNLYGLDIDDRAGQLAAFALMMKARSKNRRIFRRKIKLNICSIQESNTVSKEAIDYFTMADFKSQGRGHLWSPEGLAQLGKDTKYLMEIFHDAKEYGSILNVEEIDIGIIEKRLEEVKNKVTEDLYDIQYKEVILEKFPSLIKQAKIMGSKYDVVCTNPPYMGSKRGMNKSILEYVSKNYPASKYDLYSVFIEKCINFTKRNRMTAMITQHTWMFLSSYSKLRGKLLKQVIIGSLLHLGSRAFEEISGEVVQTSSFILRNPVMEMYKGVYDRLIEYNAQEKEKVFLRGESRHNNIMQKDFLLAEGNPIIYWTSNKILGAFSDNPQLNSICIMQNGPDSKGKNDVYFRYWYEVNRKKIKFNALEFDCGVTWFSLNKGGNTRWYGLNLYIAKDEFCNNNEGFFKSGISWSDLSSKFNCRFIPIGFSYNNHGKMCFVDNDRVLYVLGFLNSIVANTFVHLFTVRTKYEVGYVGKIPIIYNNQLNVMVNRLVKYNISISKTDWDSFESSWNFQVHPFLKHLDLGDNYRLTNIFTIWETETEEAFAQLKANEEELNRIFIEIYGLQDELTPEVEDKDITISVADRGRDIKSLISYGVGCMFGRYSLDEEGLIYAGGDFSDKWLVVSGQYYLKEVVYKYVSDALSRVGSMAEIHGFSGNSDFDMYQTEILDAITNGDTTGLVSRGWENAEFIDWKAIHYSLTTKHYSAIKDNVLVIPDGDYFEDDIVNRFVDFVRVTFGEKTLEENLDYIGETLGQRASETSRQAIRRYFLKDFYKDHVRTYKKRPIYWLFNSGRQDGFKALIYLHRYDISTIARVRTDYLHKLQRMYEAEVRRLDIILDSDLAARDKAAAQREKDKINKQIEECLTYDQIIAHMAHQKIDLDLDDGVKHNYELFQGVEVPQGEGRKPLKADLLGKI